ncbi:MAG: inosine/xanthosine triphosphatase [Candidatus Verstraetearchaeota archaeon]|nr:inosine/xanthosine triphosphatase [Candidatus Verstraetearchaeota archaeon]
MLVVVGTSNPIKVRAVENVLSKFFKVSVVMKDVPSDVLPQPVGLEMTIKGAVLRARNALNAESGAELGVGIEAGLMPVPGTISGYMDQQFAAIVDRQGRLTLGGGPAFEYPRSLVGRVLGEGIEVGTAMEKLTGIKGLGRKQGAIGFFSKGRLDRTGLTECAVLMALIPRLNEGIYFGQVRA